MNTTVTATPEADGWYKYDAENSKISDTLYANGKTTLTVVYEDNSVAAKYNAKYVKQENGAITLNAANFNVQLAGVEKMYVDGKEVAVTPVSATEISIPAAAGVRQIAVYDGDKCYYGDVTVADYVITNQATLQGWYSKISSAKYTVVANDVVCDGTDLVDWGTWEQNMTGTFDGLGHTISNAYYYGGLLNNGNMAAGSAFKNVTFDNLTVSSMYYALFGRYMNGALIENVNANVNYTAFDTINGGLITHQTLGYRLGQVDTFRNCNFNFTVPAGDVDKVAKVYSDNEGYDGAVLENVTIIFNGKVAKAGEAYDGSEGKPAVTLGEKSSWTNVTIIDKDDTETLTSSQKGVLIDATEATLDMTKFAKSVTISDLKVNGAAANWEIKGTNLVIETTPGAKTLTITDKAAGKIYTLQVAVGDYGITDQASLKTWGDNRNTIKYAVVLNNITCDGTDLTTWTIAMTGTLDGLGHTISGANYAYGLLADGGMATGASFKNVTFENLTIGESYYPLFGRYMNGNLIENVNMSVTYGNFPADTGLLTKMPTGRASGVMDTFRNCNFSFTLPAADLEKVVCIYSDEQAYYYTTMENVTITCNGKVAQVGETWENGAGKPAVTLTNSSWKNVTITDSRGSQTYGA